MLRVFQQNRSLAAAGEHRLSGSFSRKPTLKMKCSEAAFGQEETLRIYPRTLLSALNGLSLLEEANRFNVRSLTGSRHERIFNSARRGSR